MALTQVSSFRLSESGVEDIAGLPAPTQAKAGKQLTFRNWSWAAAAILLVIASIWFLKPANSPDALASRYFKADPGLPVTMSSTLNYQFYDGMVSYKEGDYDKAILLWQNLSSSQSPSDTLNYYIGVSYLNQKKYQEALNFLSPLAKTSGEWQEKAGWYAAIGYLRLNQPEAAAELLKSIPNYPPAKELLSELQQ